MSVQSYEIRLLADFLTVPANRRDACLADFEKWLAVIDTVRAFEAASFGVRMNTECFVWIDDDKNDTALTVAIIHEPTPPVSGVSEP
jgi:hypothetical protein